MPHVVRTSGRSNEEFLPEAFGFAVMARNLELVESLRIKIRLSKAKELTGYHPAHLTASYPDGSKTCCSVFGEVFHSVDAMGKNILGHTVLDNLMLAILKSHTSVAPRVVDREFKDERRFPGEEVDICGRWDADSD